MPLLPLLKAETLTSPYYGTNAKHYKKQFAQFMPAGNSYDTPSSAHSSIAG